MPLIKPADSPSLAGIEKNDTHYTCSLQLQSLGDAIRVLTPRPVWSTVHVAMAQKRKKTRGSLTFYWENPPGPNQGATIERVVRGHVYSRRVEPRGLLSPSEAALALDVRREFVYHLIWDGKLKAVTKKGQYMIPFSEVKAYDARRRRKGPARISE